MAPEADVGGEGYEQWKYSIYLVGFPASAGRSDIGAKVTLVTDMIQHLIPEARVFAPHGSRGYAALNLPDLSTEDDDGPVENVREVAVEETGPPLTEDKNTIGDSSSVTSLAVDQFSPEWIEEEALILLKTIHENAPTGGTAHRGKLLLAGYGFGGIVVKKAVIIANTNPDYHDVALNLSNLVFFATPHYSTDWLAWEEILLDLIKATEPSYSGWLISTLQTLVVTVAQLSHAFYRFAAKHSTTNVIEGKGLGSSAPVVGKLGEFDNDFEEVVQCAEDDFHSLMFCAVDDLDKLELLRSHFAPAYLSNQRTPITDMKDLKSQTPLITATQQGNTEAVKILVESGADLAFRDDAGKTALHYAIFNCSETAQDFATQDLEGTFDDPARALLHTAAISGNSQTTLALMNALDKSRYFKTALNTEDNQGKTPLLYAAECGYTEIIKIFLRTVASIELDDEVYQQAGNAAAKRGHLDTMKFLISVNGHIRGNRLLQAASSTGQLLVVEYLLHNDLASLASDPSLSPNPLVLAASKGHNEVVRTLLRYGASVNIEDGTGQTPLHHAVKNGRCHVVRTLLHHHANVNASDMEGNTPLHSAAMAVKSRELVRALLKAGAKRDAVDMLNQTPLHIVAREECYQSVDLLRCPENINIRDWEGKLPLYYAIHQKDIEKVKALRPDLLGSEDRIYSAFKYAVESSALNVLDFLLNLELLNEQDGAKRTIIHMAARLDSLEPLTLLLEAKSKPDVNITNELKRTPLHDAATAGRVENMRYLIQKGAKVDKTDMKKQTPLHMAARYDQLEAVAVLLEEKAEINVQDSENRTPLYCAANNGHVEIVRRLLEENANVKLISDHGWSPLHAAADNPEIAKMLIAHMADINLPKEDMWTPLHLAIHWSAMAVAKLLVEKGANFSVVNNDGKTALEMALMKNDADLVHLMLEKDDLSSKV